MVPYLRQFVHEREMSEKEIEQTQQLLPNIHPTKTQNLMQPPINVDENPAIVANHHIHHNQPLIDVDQFMRERINGSLLKLMHGFFWGFSYIFNYRLVC